MGKSIDVPECFYCHNIVEEKLHWNGIIQKNDIDLIYPVHAKCLELEESIIISTHDFERGEKYNQSHVLGNPLEHRIYRGDCGCRISFIYRDKDWRSFLPYERPNPDVDRGMMFEYCRKHSLTIKFILKIRRSEKRFDRAFRHMKDLKYQMYKKDERAKPFLPNTII